ncbi:MULTISPECIES: Calx-beta domain-containing protein [unclassified Leptolyngbya]|uniref:beta strand repeat-containing protein n=1 Tax=unclassified Leptolyngbya TaxID=2650499 RepID=UPI001684C9C2|nr:MULTISPECIES: Calx-beta domain-containing protein [unclassified Leptolyngbya]MBD1912558.1 hypothetical protein [Leptolyngbya sp. FACHB-8]MBD2154911.1 hypothetical protein [Leptolyngbya sp. FACHB-16]
MASIIGTEQTDFLVGLSSADLIFGEDGNDIVLGEAGNDVMYGNLGRDLMRGGGGNDQLDGGDGLDTIYGDAGNDNILGGTSNDILSGDAGNDRIDGGAGSDLIYGGIGTDILVGGAGQDTFVLAPRWGGANQNAADQILDFRNNTDVIQLASGLRFQSLIISAGTGNLAGSTVIRLRGTGEYLAVLRGVAPRLITATDFRSATLPARDVTRPTFANFQVTNITQADVATQTFTIQYADASGIDARSINDRDILVTGPNGFQQLARATNVVVNSPTSVTATYTLDAPGGTWDANEDGTYEVTLRRGQVFDTQGNYSVGGSLGSFQVTVPAPSVPVTITASPTSSREDGGTPIIFTLTRSTFIRDPLTINFSLGGTASRGVDYTVLGGTIRTDGTGSVTLPAGVASAAITVTPRVDNVSEEDETVILTLEQGTGYTVEGDGAATGTIVDDEAQVSVAIAPDAVFEDGGGDLVYTFTRTGFVGREITVSFTLQGTAIAGATNDYEVVAPDGTTFTLTGTTGTITFAEGQSTRELRIRPVTDLLLEQDETVSLRLSNGTGYVADTTPAVGTIRNDESEVAVAVQPTSVLEDGGVGLVYTFTRSGFTGQTATVNFTVGGTATFGPEGDYTAPTNSTDVTFTGTSGTVTFAEGETTKTVTLTPTADNLVEPDETVVLTVTEGSSYLVGGNATATGTITNDDSSIQVAITPESVLEDSNAPLTVTFTRGGFLNRPVTVDFNVGGSATLGTDYQVTAPTGTTYTFNSTSGTVTFAAGVTSRTLTIRPTPNSQPQPDRTISLEVQEGNGYVAETTEPVIGTITDDDASIALSVSDAVREDSGEGIVYTFTRSGFTGRALTVTFSTAGTALFGQTGDYTVSSTGQTFSFNGTTGSITFAPGQEAATLTLLPTADLLTIENNETVNLTLTAGSGYGITTPDAVIGTILNDDGVVTNTNNSGAGSLRQAILAANTAASIANPTITFEGQGADGEINLGSALPAITRNMTIDGPGADNLTVRRSGTTEFRIFQLNNGITATLRGLTVSGGLLSNGNGGGIFNNGGNLTLEGMIISNNAASLGGGIYHSNGTLTLRNTTVSNNNATAVGGASGGGLGIGTGTVNLFEGTLFENNFAQSSGGGLYNTGATVNITGTADNRVIFATNRTDGSGGGIYNNQGTVEVRFADFQGNQSSLRSLSGGAIFNGVGTLRVGSSIFNNVPNLPNAITGAYTTLDSNNPGL